MAAIDVGSNTIHLLVATVAPGGLTGRRHAVVLARLGRRVAADGRLGTAAVAATAETVARLVGLAREAGAARVWLAATEAVRRAADREDLVEAVQARCGLGLRILSGEEEARLSFRGATAGGVGTETEVVMFDCGGASTEIVLGRGAGVLAALSLPIGSDAVVQRHGFQDPPSPSDRAAAARTIARALEGAPPGSPSVGVATGGTAANLPILLGHPRPRTGEGTGELGPAIADRPVTLSTAELVRAQAVTDGAASAAVAAATGLHPERARLLAGGTQLLAALARHYRLADLTVTERGLRDGMLLEALAAEGGAPPRRDDPVP